mmetsp:Transcript_2624/g.4182  ORF Transcript_2624/g.4182 Transcript_2624/m.4182 type:complete len:290 (-) Transcript_2624:266-1135(-)
MDNTFFREKDDDDDDDEPWSAARGARVLAHDTSIASILVLHDRIITLGRDGDLQVWHIATLRNTRTSLPRLARARPALAPVGLSPLLLRSRLFLAPSSSKLLALSALDGGKPIWSLDLPTPQNITACAFQDSVHQILAVDDSANLHRWKPKPSSTFPRSNFTNENLDNSPTDDLHELRRAVRRAQREALQTLAEEEHKETRSPPQQNDNDQEEQRKRKRTRKKKQPSSRRSAATIIRTTSSRDDAAPLLTPLVGYRRRGISTSSSLSTRGGLHELPPQREEQKKEELPP